MDLGLRSFVSSASKKSLIVKNSNTLVWLVQNEEEDTIPTFVTQSLEEIRFWSRIMKEHAFFLSLGFTSDQTELIQEAKQFITVFERIEEQISGYDE